MARTTRFSPTKPYSGGEHRHVVGTGTKQSTSLRLTRRNYIDYDVPSTNCYSNDADSEAAVEQWLTSPVRSNDKKYDDTNNNRRSTTSIHNNNIRSISQEVVHAEADDAAQSTEMLASMMGGGKQLTSGQRLLRDRLSSTSPTKKTSRQQQQQQQESTPTQPYAPPRRNYKDDNLGQSVYAEATHDDSHNKDNIIGRAGGKPKYEKAFTFEDCEDSNRPERHINRPSHHNLSLEEGLRGAVTSSPPSDNRLLRHHAIAQYDPSKPSSRRRNLNLETLTEDVPLEDQRQQQQRQRQPIRPIPSPGMVAPPPPTKQLSSTPPGSAVVHTSYSKPRRRRTERPNVAMVRRHAAGRRDDDDEDDIDSSGSNEAGTRAVQSPSSTTNSPRTRRRTFSPGEFLDEVPGGTTRIVSPSMTVAQVDLPIPPSSTPKSPRNRQRAFSLEEILDEVPGTTRMVSPSNTARVSANTSATNSRRRNHPANNSDNSSNSDDVFGTTTTNCNSTNSSIDERIFLGGRPSVTTSRHKMKTLYQQHQKRKEEAQRQKRTTAGPVVVPRSNPTTGGTVVGHSDRTPSVSSVESSIDGVSDDGDDDDENDNNNDVPHTKSSKSNYSSSQLPRHPQPALSSSPQTTPGVASQAKTEQIQNRSYGHGEKSSTRTSVMPVPRSNSDILHQKVDGKGRALSTGWVRGSSSPLVVSDEEREKTEQNARGATSRGRSAQTPESRQQALVVRTPPIKSPFAYLRGSNTELQGSTGMLRKTNAIKLHVYDLVAYDTKLDLWGCHFPLGQCFSALNSSLHSMGTGVYHVGVEVST